MRPDNEEEKIEKLFRQVNVRRVPDSVKKGYLEELRGKLEAPASPGFFPSPALGFALILALALAGAGIYLWPGKGPVVGKEKTAAVEQSPDVNELSREMLILEMLGEDQGLFDEAGRLENDLEFLFSSSLPLGAQVSG